MRAIDIAYRHLERASRIIVTGEQKEVRARIFPLPPELEDKLEEGSVQALAPDGWASGALALHVPSREGDLGDDEGLTRVVSMAPPGTILVVLLREAAWYMRFCIGPLSEHMWLVTDLVSIANPPFELVLVAERYPFSAQTSGTSRSEVMVRNEHAYLSLIERTQLAQIQDLGEEVRQLTEALAELDSRMQEASDEKAEIEARLETLAREAPDQREVDQLRSAFEKARAQTDVVTARWTSGKERITVLEHQRANLDARLKMTTARMKAAQADLRSVRRYPSYRLERRLRRALRSPLRFVRRRLQLERPRSHDPVPQSPPPQHPAPPSMDPPAAPQGTKAKVSTMLPASVAVPRPFPALHELRVAAVLDEMSEKCFAPECELIQFTPNDWRETIEDRRPHVLFVESAWKGNQGSWQYKVGRYHHPDAGGLSDLVEFCSERNIPTVFWNKEDPVHFDRFKHAAVLFDAVFTTDADAVESYRNLPGLRAAHVGALPFAAQPRLHNPIFAGPRSPDPCFAGSYYGNRHADRRLQQEMLLDAARPLGLVIYDRNFGSEASEFAFPERFKPHIKGRLPYAELAQVYKRHRVFLNVNSVIDSPTMMSRRVYELLASGTAVVSTPSRAIRDILGDVVEIVSTPAQSDEAMRRLAASDSWTEVSRAGVRSILRGHTYADRLRHVAQTIGLATDPTDARAVSVLTMAAEPADLTDLVEWLATPLRSNRLELVVGTTDPGALPRLQEALNQGLPAGMGGTASLIDRLDEPDYYRRLAGIASFEWVLIAPEVLRRDKDLLQDLLDATLFTEAEVIGTTYAGSGKGLEQGYVEELSPRGVLVRRSLIEAEGWALDDDITARLRDLRCRGIRLYSVRELADEHATIQPRLR